MRASDNSVGGNADRVAKIQVGNRALIAAQGRLKSVKPDSGESMKQPSLELGSVRQEPRTCPVCGTKFFATADREFCPVCILHRAFGAESAATGESGSVSEL